MIKFIRKARRCKNAGGDFYGCSSHAITLPIDVIRRWDWRERQKLELVIDKKNKTIKIKDWAKK